MIAGLLYALATAADLASTSVALRLGLREGNPVVAPLIAQYGILPQIAVSAILCSILYWYSIRGGSKLVYLLAVVRWAIVLNNVGQLVVAATVIPHLGGLE